MKKDFRQDIILKRVAAANPVRGSGDIALAGAVDGVRINTTAGTFDVSSFNVTY